MKRAEYSRGRGRGRGSSRPSINEQYRPEAPVYNDHLRDLDLELDMLRRQREIIQQKQALLNKGSPLSSQRQNNFTETSSSFDYRGPKQRQFGNNSAAEFSLSYQNSPNTANNSYKQSATKRPAKNWQDSSLPKRSNAQMGISPWASSSNAQDTHNMLQPFTSYKSESAKKMLLFKPYVKPRTDFKPTKVTKPKAQTMPLPNKLQTYPPKEANKLVSVAVGKVKSDEILRPDVQPSPQLTGRLELALGQIVKDVKKQRSNDPDLSKALQFPFVDRLLKTTVRSRITAMMMNKTVGHFSKVIELYREKFPEHTDEDLINMVKEALKNRSTEKPEEDEARRAIKEEVMKVLDGKVQELLNDKGRRADS